MSPFEPTPDLRQVLFVARQMPKRHTAPKLGRPSKFELSWTPRAMTGLGWEPELSELRKITAGGHECLRIKCSLAWFNGYDCHGSRNHKPSPEFVASPPQAPYDWSGFYVGGHFGYGWGSFGPGTNPIPSFAIILPTSVTGLIGGYQVGSNFHFSNNIVVGWEADVTFRSAKSGSAILPTPFNYDVQLFRHRARTDRICVGSAFPYVTGGVAWGQTKVDTVDDERPSDCIQFICSLGLDFWGWHRIRANRPLDGQTGIRLHQPWRPNVCSKHRSADHGSGPSSGADRQTWPELPPVQCSTMGYAERLSIEREFRCRSPTTGASTDKQRCFRRATGVSALRTKARIAFREVARPAKHGLRLRSSEGGYGKAEKSI